MRTHATDGQACRQQPPRLSFSPDLSMSRPSSMHYHPRFVLDFSLFLSSSPLSGSLALMHHPHSSSLLGHPTVYYDTDTHLFSGSSFILLSTEFALQSSLNPISRIPFTPRYIFLPHSTPYNLLLVPYSPFHVHLVIPILCGRQRITLFLVRISSLRSLSPTSLGDLLILRAFLKHRNSSASRSCHIHNC